ncbi:MAG: rRNA adenine N-6-methyltransferase family protein, partial [Clostridia bacterium]
FTPPPKVDSAFIRLDMREAPPLAVKDEKLLFRMLRASFSLRRKTLQNALGSVMEASKVSAALAKMGLSATVRGEALSVVEWITLANACGE